jgi:hypothetical protein
MFDSLQGLSRTEMQVVDLQHDYEFVGRPIREREPGVEISGMNRLARVFAQSPEMILQELVDVSIDICGAESAGITLEESPLMGEFSSDGLRPPASMRASLERYSRASLVRAGYAWIGVNHSYSGSPRLTSIQLASRPRPLQMVF